MPPGFVLEAPGEDRAAFWTVWGDIFPSFFKVFRAGARTREQRPDPAKTTVFIVWNAHGADGVHAPIMHYFAYATLHYITLRDILALHITGLQSPFPTLPRNRPGGGPAGGLPRLVYR